MSQSMVGKKEGEDASHALPLTSHYRNTWGPIWTKSPNNWCKTAFDVSIFFSMQLKLMLLWLYSRQSHVALVSFEWIHQKTSSWFSICTEAERRGVDGFCCPLLQEEMQRRLAKDWFPTADKQIHDQTPGFLALRDSRTGRSHTWGGWK